MGFRFRRRVRLAPGVRLNLSRSLPSVSAGRRGATLNLGRRGARGTVGLPGTGLSYTTPYARTHQSGASATPEPVAYEMWVTVGICTLRQQACDDIVAHVEHVMLIDFPPQKRWTRPLYESALEKLRQGSDELERVMAQQDVTPAVRLALLERPYKLLGGAFSGLSLVEHHLFDTPAPRELSHADCDEVFATARELAALRPATAGIFRERSWLSSPRFGLYLLAVAGVAYVVFVVVDVLLSH